MTTRDLTLEEKTICNALRLYHVKWEQEHKRGGLLAADLLKITELPEEILGMYLYQLCQDNIIIRICNDAPKKRRHYRFYLNPPPSRNKPQPPQEADEHGV